MPKAYIYNITTGELESEIEAVRDEARSLLTGRDCHIRPYNSTLVPPLPRKDGYAVIWDGGKWTYAEDHRGRYAVSSGGIRHIRSLGQLSDNERLLTDEETAGIESGRLEFRDGRIAERIPTASERKASCVARLTPMLMAMAIDGDAEAMRTLRSIVAEYRDICSTTR